MVESSAEQVFARIERIRRKAERLLQGHGGAREPLADESDELEAFSAHVELRLPRLVRLFDLDALAVDVLMCLMAAEYDPLLRLLMRAVQREQGRPWLELGTIAELLDLPPIRIPELGQLFVPGGALREAALALVDDRAAEAPVVSRRVKIAARVADHLLGRDNLPEGFTRCQSHELVAPLMEPSLALSLRALARRSLMRGEPLIVEITAPGGCGKRSLACDLAQHVGMQLLVLDLATVEPERLAEALAEAHREAYLENALLCLAHWDAHLPSAVAREEEPGLAPPPRRLAPPLLQHLRRNRSILFLTAKEREPLLPVEVQGVVHAELGFPTPGDRARLLEASLMRSEAVLSSGVDLDVSGRRFALDPARIEAAVRGAVQLARLREPEAATPEIGHGELVEACTKQLNHELATVARRITSTYRWQDLVVCEEVYDTLREMISYVRHADQVYQRWGFGERHGLSQGISVLLAGPPGTGKTMCAGVMARELDMELFQIDLSRVVSKWIGETEKNLSRVFDEASRSGAIILFDEADSLFAKRTEVKSSVDRYANLEVNFLLQRMEQFRGITMLTTNFEDSIDPAFKRRLTFRLRFERPDAEARGCLWKKMFPAGCELAPDVSFEKLGQLYEMSGGNIRNAAVRAAFQAAAEERAVDLEICMLAAEKECREMGLLVKSRVAAPEQPRPEPAIDSPPPTDGRLFHNREQWPKNRVPVTHPRR